MKVVLFCGGLGTRLRDYSDALPKPMVEIGYRPILWHVMKYYAHFGHTEFILCLGYKADSVKNYFINYNEALSNDFVLTRGGTELRLLNRDIDDWSITFVDTGPATSIGQRLRAVRPYLEDDAEFLANYSDGLTDLDLTAYIDHFRSMQRVASFLSVRSTHSYHVVSAAPGGLVTGVQPISEADVWINAGYFAFTSEIFDFIEPGEDLVYAPFERLIKREQLVAYKYEGFWTAMDTFKDKQQLDDMYETGNAPWEVWKPGSQARAS
jgi:glucose-1-phosphate cytidylyltransferase